VLECFLSPFEVLPPSCRKLPPSKLVLPGGENLSLPPGIVFGSLGLPGLRDLLVLLGFSQWRFEVPSLYDWGVFIPPGLVPAVVFRPPGLRYGGGCFGPPSPSGLGRFVQWFFRFLFVG